MNRSSPFGAKFFQPPASYLTLAKARSQSLLDATLGHDTVMARQQNVVVASFHPELTSDREVHRYFVEDMLN